MEDNTSLQAIIGRLEPAKFDDDDKTILIKLDRLAQALHESFAEFEFSGAVQTIYSFFWGDFCDWYVEVSKTKLQDERMKDNCLAIQDLVIREILIQLHPFTPFITEDLWHALGFGGPNDFIQSAKLEFGLISSSKLSPLGQEPEVVFRIEKLQAFTAQARALKADHNLASRRDVRFFVKSADAEWQMSSANLGKLLRMCGAAEILRKDDVEGAPAVVTPLGTLYLDLASTVDTAAEKQRLTKELETLAKHIAGTETRLANTAFTDKAPPQVIAGARKQLADQKAKRAELERLLKAL
jgi:valyl-tRNA synthetase